MSDKILFVDDEKNVLEGFQRNLHKHFTLQLAVGPEAGLEALAQPEPFSVIVSDLRMPGMDGIHFLAKAREQHPDSIRIMLTGQADLSDAVAAVNEGNIFRFLTKPCQTEMLQKALSAGVQQYHLVIAERELLEKTLSGAIKLLTDILSLANPQAFSRADRLKRTVGFLCGHYKLPDAWQFELAAMLSQIGCITLPPDVLKRYYAGERLALDEQGMISALPAVGAELLSNIPRLERVARILAGFSGVRPSVGPVPEREPIQLGAQMLLTAVGYDEGLTKHHGSHLGAIEELTSDPDRYDPELVRTLQGMVAESGKLERRKVAVFDLTTAMILDEDLKTTRGVLLVTRGQSVSPTLIKSLRNYVTRREIQEEVQVLVPEYKPAG